MTKKVYIGYDQYGNSFDVSLEIQGYLDKIAKLENEVLELNKKLAEKPKEVKVVKKHEW
jgi:hypothetical protein